MMLAFENAIKQHEANHTNTLAQITKDYGNGAIAAEETKKENEIYQKRISGTRRMALTYVESELEKVEKHLKSILLNMNINNLNEINALQYTNISPFMSDVLREKYANDYFALEKLVELTNIGKNELNQEHFVTADEMMQSAKELKMACADIVMRYTTGICDPNIPSERVNSVFSQICNMTLESYYDSFDAVYLTESELDNPVPLTQRELNQINIMFQLNDKKPEERTQQLLDEGYYDLLYRSEYAKYIPDDYVQPARKLSQDGEDMLDGFITPAMYAGLEPKMDIRAREGWLQVEDATEHDTEQKQYIDCRDYDNNVEKTLEAWNEARKNEGIEMAKAEKERLHEAAEEERKEREERNKQK
jgi:hypothetical protein